jgi:hypothetical protein
VPPRQQHGVHRRQDAAYQAIARGSHLAGGRIAGRGPLWGRARILDTGTG